jgi:hypothetical protein
MPSATATGHASTLMTATPTVTAAPCTPGPDQPCLPTQTPVPVVCSAHCVYLPIIRNGE